MKQRKTASIIFAAGMLLLAGCQKDDLQGRGERMMLNLEAFGSGSKTVLGDDDRSLQWLSGDQVRINGVDYTVSTSGDEAYVSDVPEASSYKALFPASMAEGHSMSGSTVTATLPRQYEYRTEGGLQVLDAPLAAVGDGSGGLTFRHLTGALTVVIKNTTSNTLYVDSVVLSSAQQLCGDITVDFDNLTAISPNTSPSYQDTMVLLTVPYNTLSVAAGAEVKVQIPVLPVSDANRFTVHVATRYQGTRYDFDRRQGATSNALARNEMGYVPASIATSGLHISVRPLFKTESIDLDDARICSTLDFLLLADAVNNKWAIPAPYNGAVGSYDRLPYVYFIGTIDMEGYTIPQLEFSQSEVLDINGLSSCVIKNLTVEGNSLFANCTPENAQFIHSITFNNLTINAEKNATGVYGLLELLDSRDGDVWDVAINGLTFNLNNQRPGNNVSIGGILGEINTGDWVGAIGNCSVNDITVNVTGNPFRTIRFGGVVGDAISWDNTMETRNCSYTQNTPLNLSATEKICYGGFASEIDYYGPQDGSLNSSTLEYNLKCDFVHNVSLNAPEVVTGGIAGQVYAMYTGIENKTLQNGLVVNLNGTIDIYSATTVFSGNEIGGLIVDGESAYELGDYVITYDGTVNGVLGITVH